MEEKQILLVGLGTEARKVRDAFADTEVTVLEADSSDLALTVGQVFTREPRPVEDSFTPSVIMFRGISREELDSVLPVLRRAGLSHQPLKAMVTPTNWSWRLGDLYGELKQEQQVMGALIRLKKLRDSMPMPDFRDIPAMKARIQAETLLKGGEGATVEAIEMAISQLQKFC